MDKMDLRILRHLQEDGRASSQQVGDAVGLSAAPAWRRVRALEAAGVIQGYHARIDRRQVDLKGCMFTHISLDRHAADIVERFEQAVRAAPEVLECHAVTGDADYLLKIVVPDPEAYDQFLHRFLFNLPGVRQTRTVVVLRELKHDVRLPL